MDLDNVKCIQKFKVCSAKNKTIGLKSVDFLKPVTQSLFLSKSVVIFVIVILKMITLFERNEDCVTGFLK